MSVEELANEDVKKQREAIKQSNLALSIQEPTGLAESNEYKCPQVSFYCVVLFFLFVAVVCCVYLCARV